MIEWIFKGIEGKMKGKQAYLHTVLDQPQKLGRTITALGLEFDPGEFDLDLDEVEGRECIGIMVSDEWNGQKRSKLSKVIPTGTEDDEAEEEDDKPRRKRSNGKTKVVKASEDEIKEMDESELEDWAAKNNLETDLSKLKSLTKKRNAVLEEATERDLIS
jgi:hypothetical protein